MSESNPFQARLIMRACGIVPFTSSMAKFRAQIENKTCDESFKQLMESLK